MKKALTLSLFLSLNCALHAQFFSVQPTSLVENIENFTSNSYYEIIDFDNDGDLDIIAGDAIKLYLNNGDGSYEQIIVSEDRAFRATGDFNSDGNIDILSADGIHINNGDNIFEVENSSKDGIRYVLDYKGDTIDDFLTLEETEDPDVFVTYGDSESDFSTSGLWSENILSASHAIYNQDDLTDVAVLEDSQIRVFKPSDSGSTSMSSYDIENAEGYLISANIDSDEDIDLLWGTTSNGIALSKNNGNGAFPSSTNLDISIGGQVALVRGLTLADYDSDGDNDLMVIAYASLTNSEVSYYTNNGSGNFTLSQILYTGALDVSEAIYSRCKSIDIDADGDIDLVVNLGDGNISVFENNSIVSVRNLLEENTIDIFPNPFVNTFHIKSTNTNLKNVVVEIRNNLGELVKTESGILPMKLDATSLSSTGVYVITVLEESSLNILASKKVLKVN